MQMQTHWNELATKEQRSCSSHGCMWLVQYPYFGIVIPYAASWSAVPAAESERSIDTLRFQKFTKAAWSKDSDKATRRRTEDR